MSLFSPRDIQELILYHKELLGDVATSVTAALRRYKPDLRRATGVLPPRNLPRSNPDAGGNETTPGFVQFAPDGGTEALMAVQGNDSRLLAAGNLAGHLAAPNPHPQYQLEANNLYLPPRDDDVDPATALNGTMYAKRGVAITTQGQMTLMSGFPWGWNDDSTAPWLRLIVDGKLFSTERLTGV